MFLNNSDLLAFRFLTMKLIFMCRCVFHDYGGRCSFMNPREKSGCKSAWQKLIVGKPLQSTYHNGLSVQVGLKIWHDAGGKYLQVGPVNHPSPATARTIVVREWSPFAYKRIYLGRTKTGFYVAQTGLQGSDY